MALGSAVAAADPPTIEGSASFAYTHSGVESDYPSGWVFSAARQLLGGLWVVGDSATRFGWQPGVGVDVNLSPQFAFRVAGDARQIASEGLTRRQLRLGVGVVFRR